MTSTNDPPDSAATDTAALDARVGRRKFIRGAGVAAAAVAVPGWLSACAKPAGAGSTVNGMTTIKATHGTGLCNLGIFLAKERTLGKADGVSIDFVVTPTNADIATLFGAGQVEASLIPYSNFMTLYDAGAPVKIVAGGGVQGCVVVAQAGITSAEGLRGKTLGTFQADTLEVLPYDYLQKSGMSFNDVQVKYFGTSPEMAQAFISGAIDSMCHIEPYATQALNARPGSVKLTDGTDLYGPGYTDCVLAVRSQLLDEKPQVVKGLIKALMIAQQQAEQDRPSAVQATVGSYFKTNYADALDASTKQPNVVDQRGRTSFILARGQVLKDLGYVKKLPDQSVFDYGPLQQVIAENQALYSSLKLKYA
jgi:NitT/TauT family transport system substrate-binding protein